MNQDAKEEVRARLNIEDVIGEYVQLKRAGRSWKGLSPFSGEKTPSFFVSPDKQIWHDFSSNKGGDVFSFVMEVEGLDFRGALELLARKAGVDLSLYESKGSQDLSRKKQRLLKALDLAATFYQRQMLADPRAVEYVSKVRGLSRQVVHDFKIGYAPGPLNSGGDALKRFLLNKGFTQAELRDAGLIGSRGTDMFRDRMIVGLADGSGQTIGFTARLISGDNGPKYINTPQTLVYDKGRHVFGLHLAKEAIRSVDFAVVVEGNLDVISSHQVGVRQVVATAGTALTEYHLKTLSRLTPYVRLCFDGDKAGLAATERAIPIAQTVGVELSVISLGEGVKDPDELIKQDPQAWEAAIDRPQPALEWLIEQYAARVDLTSAGGKRQLTTQAMNILTRISDPVEREHYLRLLADKTSTTLQALNDRLHQFDEPANPKLKSIKTAVSTSKDEFAYQDYLLALMTLDVTVHDVAKKLTPEELEGEQRQRLFAYLFDHPADLNDEIPQGLKDIETYVKIVLFKAEARYDGLDGQSRLIEAVSLVRQIKDQKRKQMKQQLLLALRDAEARHDEAEMMRLRTELNDLIKEEAYANKSHKR